MTTELNATAVILAPARARRGRDRTALIHDGGALTYGELEAAVARAAGAFAALGVGRAERVCFLLNDSPLYCAAFLGALQAGAVAIPLNTRLAASDLAFIVADSGARLLVADPDYLGAARPTCAGAGIRLLSAQGSADSLAAAMDASAPRAAAATAADEPAFWLYSSGTTGKPKAIIHSHANAAHAGKLLREVVRADENTVVLATSKLFFAFALDNAILGPLSCGGTIILNAGWPEPELIADQVARYRPNVFFTVPTFFRRLLALPPARLEPLASVALTFTGGERLPDAVAAQWRERVGREILVLYGMSETFCNVTSNFPGRYRRGTCGLPLDGVQTELRDADGRPAPPGEPGLLWVKHPSLALGYKDPPATARAFRAGWFCTGDLFTRDADGFWSHQGRADELLKVAGQWVKPTEVEEAALADARIREAACVVVPDLDGYDRLALFVAGNGAAQGELAAIAAAKVAHLPRHSQPKWIREAAALPRTGTGKVQRFLLRDSLVAELGSGRLQ